jgi:nitroreductase
MDPALSLEQLHEVVALAALAPSVHNTQPWRFAWDGAALTVLEDATRALPVLDPRGRERVLSCGAAIEHAVLAFAEIGRHCDVELLPERGAPDVLARLVPGAPESAATAERALVAAIPRRYTDRGVFLPRPVPADVVDRLRAAAEQAGAWLRTVERTEEKVALAVLQSHADEIESANPDYVEELRRWRTHDRTDEGIPDAAVPPEGVADRGSDFRLRDFDPGRLHERQGDGPPEAEHPLVVIIGTADDERVDWIRAGMAMGRVLLQATADDLAASPMTQVVEVERLRARLRQELDLVGMPQVVLRLGYGQGQMTTRRRPVQDVLTLT